MKYIAIITCLVSLSAWSADKVRHQAMTNTLNEYTAPAGSSSPNKSLVYFSSRDNVDLIDYQEVAIDDADVSDGVVEITRPVAARNGVLTPAQVATPMTSCQADKGEVTIQASKLLVYTTSLPVRVRCQDSSGNMRQFFQTIYKP